MGAEDAVTVAALSLLCTLSPDILECAAGLSAGGHAAPTAAPAGLWMWPSAVTSLALTPAACLPFGVAAAVACLSCSSHAGFFAKYPSADPTCAASTSADMGVVTLTAMGASTTLGVSAVSDEPALDAVLCPSSTLSLPEDPVDIADQTLPPDAMRLF